MQLNLIYTSALGESVVNNWHLTDSLRLLTLFNQWNGSVCAALKWLVWGNRDWFTLPPPVALFKPRRNPRCQSDWGFVSTSLKKLPVSYWDTMWLWEIRAGGLSHSYAMWGMIFWCSFKGGISQRKFLIPKSGYRKTLYHVKKNYTYTHIYIYSHKYTCKHKQKYIKINCMYSCAILYIYIYAHLFTPTRIIIQVLFKFCNI